MDLNSEKIKKLESYIIILDSIIGFKKQTMDDFYACLEKYKEKHNIK